MGRVIDIAKFRKHWIEVFTASHHDSTLHVYRASQGMDLELVLVNGEGEAVTIHLDAELALRLEAALTGPAPKKGA